MTTTPNIFRPRNDWHLISLNSRKYKKYSRIEMYVADKVKQLTGVHPFSQIRYRGRVHVTARYLYVIMLVRHTDKTYKDIAKAIGKDHTTINHAINTIDNLYETDRIFKDLYDTLDENMKEFNPVFLNN